jgi:hypothetical protein
LERKGCAAADASNVARGNEEAAIGAQTLIRSSEYVHNLPHRWRLLIKCMLIARTKSSVGVGLQAANCNWGLEMLYLMEF